MNKSIATINAPEFINLQPLEINPLMSSCEIKVLYIGGNRNGSFITKEVATEMSKTLRGAPIVGYYRESKEDFTDHGEQVVFDDEGMHFNCLTVPYGFVSPDAKVWYQTCEDTDDFGNTVEREYLMTNGYLWTGQFEEAKAALGGKPQSMELDNDSLEGKWAFDNQTGMEFFIINDATFSKLCILGSDVEPCFEGASVTAPGAVSAYSKVDEGMKRTLFTMMEDLKFAIGGETMDKENTIVEENVEVIETTIEETPAVIEEIATEETTVETEIAAEPTVETTVEVTETAEVSSTDFAKADEEEDDKKEEDEEEDKYAKNEEDEEEDEEDEDEEDKYSLIKNELETLKLAYAKLQEDNAELSAYKTSVESEKKDALINEFYILSDEDKKEVIENKNKYSLEEIEAKLSVICVRKRVSFESEENKEAEVPATTFNLVETETNVPAFISALKNVRDNK